MFYFQGRAKMLQIIQDDLNRRQQQQQHDKENREKLQDLAEKEENGTVSFCTLFFPDNRKTVYIY